MDSSVADAENALRERAVRESWLIPLCDLQIGTHLITTFKSHLHISDWRGCKVVAKYPRDDVDQQAEPQGSPEDDLESGKRSASGSSQERAALVSTKMPKQPNVKKEYLSASLAELTAELLHEIDILAGLRHPNVVNFWGACLGTENVPIFITEYMEGGDLETYYQKRRKELQQYYRPSVAQVTAWASAVASALWYLHSRHEPIVHRDLKPLNILLSKDLQAKITDFGISKIMVHTNKPDNFKMSGGVGSWLYMAPEVVRYQDYNEKVDVFSFGLILFFMCSGRNPFYDLPSREPDANLKEYLKGNEPRPKTDECPAVLRRIMESAWSPQAAQRPHASELLHALHSAGLEKDPSSCVLL